MPALIQRIVESGGRVERETIEAFWIDVAKLDDFEQARAEVETWNDL